MGKGGGKKIWRCFEDKEKIIVLIRGKQLNANDEAVIQKINDELYIGTYKIPEEQA